MTLEETLVDCLASGAGLSGVKIRPGVAAPSDQPPYIVYTQFAGSRVQSLEGDSGLANPHMQLDIYAVSNEAAVTLRRTAYAAVMGCVALGAVLIEQASGYEPDTKRHRQRMEFSFWFND